MKKGIIYFYVHLVIDLISFYIMCQYVSFEKAFLLDLIYDFIAFVPQGLFGYAVDKNKSLFLLPVGLVVALFALVFLKADLSGYIVAITIGLGNAMVHISGAEDTLRGTKGKITPCALYVSGGSFGIALGKLLAEKNAPIWVALIILLSLIVPIILLINKRNDNDDVEFNFENKKLDPIIIVALATFVVAIRSFMGYGIPSSWNKTLAQMILLYSFMGIGKFLGGVLVDKIGLKLTAILSTVCAIPFLVFGDNIMVLSLIGILLFSMTMPITLVLIVSCMKKYPGVAFGMTTIGLFLGAFPIFFFRITSLIANICVIIGLSIICLVILLFISKKEENKNAL